MLDEEIWDIPIYEPECYEVVFALPSQIIQAREEARLVPPKRQIEREPETETLRKTEQSGLSAKGLLVLLCLGAILLVGMISHAPSSTASHSSPYPPPVTGSFGLDYVAGPPPATLRAEGVSFVCRYLSEDNAFTHGKILTHAEARSLSASHVALISNYEWYATRALEGYGVGVQDAQIAAAQHAAAGGPQERPIYFSVDTDTAGSQVAAYFQGVASVIGIQRTGAYGSYQVLKYLFDQGLIRWGWQTYAWSYGAWEPRAQIQQYQNSMVWSGHSVDYDRVTTHDFGQWLV